MNIMIVHLYHHMHGKIVYFLFYYIFLKKQILCNLCLLVLFGPCAYMYSYGELRYQYSTHKGFGFSIYCIRVIHGSEDYVKRGFEAVACSVSYRTLYQ